MCSLALEEDLGGTASRQKLWLLIEQPGAWGPNALLESELPSDIAEELDQRRRQHHVRILLIRRGPGRPTSPDRRWFFVRSADEVPTLGGGWFSDPSALLDLDLGALVTGGEALEDHPDPLLAVCTHGRHDPCCADNGRPVARALRGLGVDVWECSHIGGDRFAANVVTFPHALYHGRVAPETAVELVEAYRGGRIEPSGFRGRAR